MIEHMYYDEYWKSMTEYDELLEFVDSFLLICECSLTIRDVKNIFDETQCKKNRAQEPKPVNIET